jgi:hypothetical protein
MDCIDMDCIDAVRASARVRRRLVWSAALAEKLMAALPIPVTGSTWGYPFGPKRPMHLR